MSDLAALLSYLDLSDSRLGFQIGDLTFGPVETVLLALAVVLAVLSMFELGHMANRETRQERLDALRDKIVIPPAEEDRAAGSSWYERLGAVVALTPIVGSAEQAKLLAALAAAGIRGPGKLATFIAIKFVGLIGLPTAVWLLMEWGEVFPGELLAKALPLVVAILFGWRAPDIVLSRLAKRRRIRLELGFPDALDLLVICAEAGLGLEQAVEQVGRDLRGSAPEVAEEFAIAAAEMYVLTDRRIALENMAQRTGLANLRSMISILNQSIRFGTPLAESLRTIAAEMRAIRMTRFEERAARLSVILTIPLMTFIMPCLFIVLLGPAALQMMDTFARLFP